MQTHIPPLLMKHFKQVIEPACWVNGILQHAVLQAMLSVPRHLFVDLAIQHRAYDNDALPIGYAQTISQPEVVACMSAHLYQAQEDSHHNFDKILEIGTGSGYQSAILSKLWSQVYTIERIENLYHKVPTKHQKLGIHNIHCFYGDGYLGLAEHAPFGAIILTACCHIIPPILQDQLMLHGSIIAPVEYKNRQFLMRYEKKQNPQQGDIQWNESLICEVKFVPMLGGIIGSHASS